MLVNNCLDTFYIFDIVYISKIVDRELLTLQCRHDLIDTVQPHSLVNNLKLVDIHSGCTFFSVLQQKHDDILTNHEVVKM